VLNQTARLGLEGRFKRVRKNLFIFYSGVKRITQCAGIISVSSSRAPPGGRGSAVNDRHMRRVCFGTGASMKTSAAIYH
jgi:hypothetical protein